jgi:phosphatidylglycerophosphate synthase
MKYLPLAMIIFRFLCAPAIILISFYFGQSGSPAIIILMYLGLVSDILDGIIARKYNATSELLRRLDSQADLVFWLSIGISAWLLHPEIIAANNEWIIMLFIFEAFCYLLSFLKFGKETSNHAYLAKLWGLSLLAAFTSIIGFGVAGIAFYITIALAIIFYLDRILITLILTHWTHDIPSFLHACKIRRGLPIRKFKLFN